MISVRKLMIWLFPFESLHHFKPQKKLELYRKIYDTLKMEGFS